MNFLNFVSFYLILSVEFYDTLLNNRCNKSCGWSKLIDISSIGFDLDTIDSSVNSDQSQISNNRDDNMKQGVDGDNKNEKKDSPKLDFKKPLYIINEEKQKLKKGYHVPFEIQMNQDINVKGQFKLSDAQKLALEEYFAISSDKEKVSCDVSKDIPPENVKNVDELIFLLEFIPEEPKDANIRTVLVMFLHDKPPEKPEKISFEHSNYKIETVAEYTGIIFEFVAKLDKNDGKSTIKYNLMISDNENLKNSLKLNERTGILSVIKTLAPGTYNFKISAKIDGNEDSIHNEADVALIIDHIVVCDSKEVKFPYSQLVKHIPEGKSDEILSPMEIYDKCVYKISSQKPEGDYFELNEKTGALKMVKGVKRDSDLFKNSKYPQFLLKLFIDCGLTTNVRSDDSRQNDAEHYFDIAYDPKSMLLVILVDKSEATSIFNTDKIVVGYPRKYDIIAMYGPPRVTSVSDFVNDRDAESPLYSIAEENSPFSVDPHSGNVYPLSYCNKDDDYSFTVLAKDTSKEEKLKITVKLLSTGQIVEVYFIDVTLENFDKLLQDYNSNMDVEIKSLAHAVIPITNEQRQSNKALSDKKQIHLLKALCYAFDKKEQNTIVKGEIIVDKLKTSSNVFSIQIFDNKKIPDSRGRNNSNSFIVTTGIFSVILALGVIVTIFYLVYMRRRNLPVIIMRRNGNTRNSVTALEEDMEGPSQTRWIGPHSNVTVYNRYDQTTNANVFPNAAFEAQRVTYSDTRAETVMMQNKMQTQSNDLLSSGVSSFKPISERENFSSDNNVHDVYRDLEFPNEIDAASGSNNVPVLDVTSLPPISDLQWRRRTNAET